MADYEYRVTETHTKRHSVILNTYPNSYAAELSKALTGIYEKFKDVNGHYPQYDDTIKVVTSDDDIILYFDEKLKA